MDVQQLFQNFQYQDLQWFVPVLAGLVIVVGALLVGLFRGITGGVLLALLFGGLMSLSPTLLATLEKRTAGVGGVSVRVARGAAELSLLNSEVVTELSSVMGTLRNAVASLPPVVAGDPAVAPDPAALQLLTQALADTEAQLDRTTTGIEQINRMRADLESEVARLEAEMAPAGTDTPN